MRKFAVAVRSEFVLRHLLVIALRADDAGNEPALAGQRASVEGPLHQAACKTQHRECQLHAFRVLQVAGIDWLVLELGRQIGKQRLYLVRPDGNDDMRERFAVDLQIIRNGSSGGAHAHLPSMLFNVSASGLGKQRRKVHPRQQQIAGAGWTRQGIPQHRGEHPGGGALRERVERRHAERPPEVMPEDAVLAVLPQQRLDRDVLRDCERNAP